MVSLSPDWERPSVKITMATQRQWKDTFDKIMEVLKCQSYFCRRLHKEDNQEIQQRNFSNSMINLFVDNLVKLRMSYLIFLVLYAVWRQKSLSPPAEYLKIIFFKIIDKMSTGINNSGYKVRTKYQFYIDYEIKLFSLGLNVV